ncbi:UNVERIFIED_CONTAM: hypothetical protein Sangu_2475900 [Sesamum angustifolium]|uniref:RNase H type-1 domain-containing protein n=1 Tax=Sesamum angustifolium TaxID=2727405 RepID=A0AAW2IQW7_9LAMI
MVLSKNSTDTLKDTLPTLLGLQREDQQERYLGLPSVVGRSKKGVFSYIRDRVWQRIKGWWERNLSQAGKATMIQSVLQAIPTFAMRSVMEDLVFRPLKAFNLAMLAKQLWRLLMKPQCLLSQVLKARYYPSSSPLEAKVRYRPSLTWRSIISYKEIIAAGSRWSVGSGSSIKIWKDTWLPRPVTFKPITPPPEDHDQNVVAAMIDPETKEWDRQIIENIFNPEDQELILKIPLGRESLPDTRCWHFTQNGLFTVRSAYFLAVKSLNSQSSSTRSNDPLNARWKTIWNVKLPPKVRLFVWKLASDALPTDRRGLADLPWTAISAWRGDTLEWITNVSSFLTVHDFEKFLVNCWFIWWNRNRSNMENIFSTPYQTVTMANSFMTTYREANVPHSLQHVHHKNTLSKWSPPVTDTIKINFDGAVLEKGSEVALAAQEVVDLAIHHGWSRVLIEGDCLSHINKLNSSDSDQSYTRPLVQDIKLATSFSSALSFAHLVRNDNTIAHKLATRAGASLYSCRCFSPAEADLFGLLEADFYF